MPRDAPVTSTRCMAPPIARSPQTVPHSASRWPGNHQEPGSARRREPAERVLGPSRDTRGCRCPARVRPLRRQPAPAPRRQHPPRSHSLPPQGRSYRRRRRSARKRTGRTPAVSPRSYRPDVKPAHCGQPRGRPRAPDGGGRCLLCAPGPAIRHPSHACQTGAPVPAPIGPRLAPSGVELLVPRARVWG